MSGVSSRRVAGSGITLGRILPRRERVSAWICKRDTAKTEAWLGLLSFGIAWRAVDIRAADGGERLASFVLSSVLHFDARVWFWGMTGNGLGTLLALGYGLWTGNTYKVRSWLMLGGSLAWSAVAVASWSGPTLHSVAFILTTPAIFSWLAAVELIHKADVAKKQHVVELHERLAKQQLLAGEMECVR